MKKLKITQITYTGFGGPGNVVFSLIEADKTNCHQWLIGFIGDMPLDKSYPSRCKKSGVSFLTFRTKAGRPYRAWLSLNSWLTDTKPDVVICHSINSILACSWYAWRHKSKLVAVEHTPNQVKSRIEWVFSLLGMLLADNVVVLTDEYRDELRHTHRWMYHPKKVSVIPNGVDTNVFFANEKSSIAPRRLIRLGMAARFSFSKRQDLLVAVIERLVVLRPTLEFELIFAGEGDELARVQDLAKKNDSAAKVKFLGTLPENEVAIWLRTLDIYVHSTEGETLSTSILQAMATGLPIVSSDIPGVTNLLGKKGEYGVCVANDVKLFALVILELIDDPICCAKLGFGARQHTLVNYSNLQMFNNYLKVIKKV
jgi:glycosyltransferase involved in cell wall biosynthesis